MGSHAPMLARRFDRALALALLVALTLPAIFAALASEGDLTSENRRATRFPKLPASIGEVETFTRGVEEWWGDRFGGRRALLELRARDHRDHHRAANAGVSTHRQALHRRQGTEQQPVLARPDPLARSFGVGDRDRRLAQRLERVAYGVAGVAVAIDDHHSAEQIGTRCAHTVSGSQVTGGCAAWTQSTESVAWNYDPVISP